MKAQQHVLKRIYMYMHKHNHAHSQVHLPGLYRSVVNCLCVNLWICQFNTFLLIISPFDFALPAVVFDAVSCSDIFATLSTRNVRITCLYLYVFLCAHINNWKIVPLPRNTLPQHPDKQSKTDDVRGWTNPPSWSQNSTGKYPWTINYRQMNSQIICSTFQARNFRYN